MKRHWILPLIAAAMVVFATSYALYVQRSEPQESPPVPPPTTPFGQTVAGAGMVEPATEASGTASIAIGSQTAGVVKEIHVRIGQEVKSGELLVELDKRQATADLNVRRAALEAAQAQARKLDLQPRPEEIPPSEAQVGVAEANLQLTKDQWERGKELRSTNAISMEDFVTREQAYQSARNQLMLAKANLALLKAGAWDPDKVIAYAAVQQARAQVQQGETQLDLMEIRAPVDGTILQLNTRPGEYLPTSAGQSLIVMGKITPLHVRVNVDEEDLPRLRLNAPARARIRGDSKETEIPMTFVRLEPYVVPKTSLTGQNTERVDTRVVQLIYALDPANPLVLEKKILVGQLVDVFIDTHSEGPMPADAAK
jgi:HlyD family secretion protein